MRALVVVASAAVVSVVACSEATEGTAPPDPEVTGAPMRDSGAASSSTSSSGAPADATPDMDGAAEAEAAGVRFVGRFDFSDANKPKTAWPGARIIARFDGTGVKATLTHTNGLEGGNTWLNVVVDGVVKAPLEITGASQEVTLAGGLAAGDHVIEIQKRTEANVGTLTFEGFTFDAGGRLLPPPPRAARRIEFLTDSTINGYGVDGDVNTTCAGGAPVAFNDARKGAAFLTAEALSAEHHLVAYSGKGLARNEDGTTTELFGSLFSRTLPEVAASAWTFASFTPDVVVVSLGGSDYGTGTTPPAGFQAAFGQLRADIRAKYGANAKIVFVVWSQLKEYNGVRQGVTAAIDGAIAGDANAWRFSLPEAQFPGDETGCHYHANAAHHQAMATLLAAELKSKMGW